MAVTQQIQKPIILSNVKKTFLLLRKDLLRTSIDVFVSKNVLKTFFHLTREG